MPEILPAQMKGWGAVIVVAGTLLVPPTSAVAKPGFFVQKPAVQIEFGVPATNGYHVTVSATNGEPGGVLVTAARGRDDREAVQYQVRGGKEKDGALDANLPGVGRVAVRFQATEVTHQVLSGNCKGRSETVHGGVFRGTIELHGEHGYTTVDSKSATGTLTHSFRQVCSQAKAAPSEGEDGSSPGNEILYSETQEGSPQVSFAALQLNFGPKFGGPLVTFIARSARVKDGVFIASSVTAEGKPAEFSVAEPAKSLENATVAPPPPFHGSASFHLDSPTSSSWEGDLTTELPGVGEVALAGPGYLSGLCLGASCTKTLPFEVQTIR